MDDIRTLADTWDEWAQKDPLWAVLTNHDKKGGLWEKDEFFQTGREHVKIWLKYIKNDLGRTINHGVALDFGCGVGRLTRAYSKYFEQCVGVDISPTMIKLAKKFNKNIKNCNFQLITSNDLREFQSDNFDFISAYIVLQHMSPEHTKRYIKEFIRIMKPNGILMFQIPGKKAKILPIEAGAYKAEFELIKCSNKMQAGGVYELVVRVLNVSSVYWRSDWHLKLCNHWRTDKGELVIINDGATPLPGALGCQEAIDLHLTVMAPFTLGKYFLELNLLHDGVTWFSKKGSQTLKIPVNILRCDEKQSVRMATKGETMLPRMEMNCIPKEEMKEFIEKECAAQFIHIAKDESAGFQWESYMYYVTKIK